LRRGAVAALNGGRSLMNEAGGRFTMVALWVWSFDRWFSGPKLDAWKMEVFSRPSHAPQFTVEPFNTSPFPPSGHLSSKRKKRSFAANFLEEVRRWRCANYDDA